MKRAHTSLAAMVVLMAQGQQRAPMPAAWCDGLPIANRMGVPGSERVAMQGSAPSNTEAPNTTALRDRRGGFVVHGQQ